MDEENMEKFKKIGASYYQNFEETYNLSIKKENLEILGNADQTDTDMNERQGHLYFNEWKLRME